MSTKKMVADKLIKTLSIKNHKEFLGMTGMKDQKKLLAFIKREDDLRDAFQRGADLSKTFGFETNVS